MQKYAEEHNLIQKSSRQDFTVIYCGLCAFNDDNRDMDTLLRIPLALLINMYCAKGSNFNSENFKKSLQSIGFTNAMVIAKIEFGLTKLRSSAAGYANSVSVSSESSQITSIPRSYPDYESYREQCSSTKLSSKENLEISLLDKGISSNEDYENDALY